MGAFICLFIVLAMTLSINTSTDSGRKKCCIICGLVLWSLLAFKDISIGIDSAVAYLPFFENTNVGLSSLFELRFINNFEPGYQIFNNIIHFITQDSNIFLMIVATVIVSPIVIFVYRHSKTPTLSFFIYAGLILYHFSFSGLRQALAISICVIALEFLLSEKKYIFFALVLLASTFHSSAIFFGILYFLRNIRLTRSISILVIFGGVFVVLNLKTVLGSLLDVVFSDGRYDGYLSESVAASYNLMLIYALVFIMVVGVGADTLEKRLLIWSTLLVTISQSLGLISSSGARIGYFFIPFIMLAIPEIISNCKNKAAKTILNIIACMFFTFFYFYTNGGGYLEVMPYKFFWE